MGYEKYVPKGIRILSEKHRHACIQLPHLLDARLGTIYGDAGGIQLENFKAQSPVFIIDGFSRLRIHRKGMRFTSGIIDQKTGNQMPSAIGGL